MIGKIILNFDLDRQEFLIDLRKMHKHKTVLICANFLMCTFI